MRIAEINGIKLEFDERTAKTIETYRVGDRVKVLKKGWNDTYKVTNGVIVGFSDFKKMPTIEVMHLNDSTFEFVYINESNKDAEIGPFNEAEALFDKERVLDVLSREIRDAENKVADLKAKRDYFVTRFAKAFEPQTESHVA